MSSNYVITISRSYGSNGGVIGEAVAKELGIPCYGRTLLGMASQISGISEEMFTQRDEQPPGRGLFRAKTGFDREGNPTGPGSEGYLTPENLFLFQSAVIRWLGNHESCVLIGRCANFVLREHHPVLRTFIYAPLEARVAHLQKTSPLSSDKLEQKIKKIDQERASYYKHYTGQLWNTAEQYDLCLDSSYLGEDACIKLIAENARLMLSAH